MGLHGRLRGLRLLPAAGAEPHAAQAAVPAVEPGRARLLRLANRFIRTHRLLHLALVDVGAGAALRRLTRGFMPHARRAGRE